MGILKLYAVLNKPYPFTIDIKCVCIHTHYTTVKHTKKLVKPIFLTAPRLRITGLVITIVDTYYIFMITQVTVLKSQA